ncbi:vanadium-dependent haloperoxidase [Piscinibacter sp. XHJ-5]|uniref:vanadium-dependent haloperoxidase n=1 Tax=Piscinibacter sp. XHJ-5 TaxID=3037797 RepID=UPI0024530FA1|nr:vanadium-dependent haloperoxidase [Piscinibacter sp. XHJ-5]
MHSEQRIPAARGWVALLLAGLAFDASADVIADWNIKTGELIAEAKLGTPPAVRVMALVQTAAYEAVKGAQGTSVDAAVAAAHRITLSKLMPGQQAAIDAACQAALAAIAEGPAKAGGIAAGEKAAAAVLAQRADEGAAAPEAYRPHTSAGAYVPTAMPAVPQWQQRKPWLMTGAAQFRPGPPPALSSETWARDFNEVKALGGKNSTRRTAEQTEIARFWEYSLPAIYHGMVRSVANQPGRDTLRNARLFAAAAQAMDDGLIGVFDAKYHYNFWRPATAIRNGDIDGHDATERDASWTPFIDTPMHPEYPSAHSVLAAAVGAVIQAEVGSATMPVLSTTSPTAKGASRRWSSVDEMTREVANARVYEGVHYRTSTEAGTAMGRRIGELAVETHLRLPH